MCRSADGELLVSSDDQSHLKLFRYPCVVQHAPCAGPYFAHASHVPAAVFTHDDAHVVSAGGSDRTLMVWEVVRERARAPRAEPHAVHERADAWPEPPSGGAHGADSPDAQPAAGGGAAAASGAAASADDTPAQPPAVRIVYGTRAPRPIDPPPPNKWRPAPYGKPGTAYVWAAPQQPRRRQP